MQTSPDLNAARVKFLQCAADLKVIAETRILTADKRKEAADTILKAMHALEETWGLAIHTRKPAKRQPAEEKQSALFTS